MTEAQQPDQDEPDPDDLPVQPRIIKADDLFHGTREIWLELDGVRYRLRITRRNKLILQK